MNYLKSDKESRWVRDLSGKPFIEMIYITEGEFTMGSNKSSYSSEKPEKQVYLSGYWIGKHPVTNEQFFHFIEETGYDSDDEYFLQHWERDTEGKRRPPEGLLQHPVVYVNWLDSVAFCRAYGLTLPSEAQWEKAARGVDGRVYPWGDEEPNTKIARCNFRNLFDGTTPVGLFDGARESYNGIPIASGESPYGVQDMAGNVWEWCIDEWDAHWLENMGKEPIDPCNCQKPRRKGLPIEQIKSLTTQQQEEEEQHPFQDTECCEAVRGSTSVPPTSAPPVAATSTRRTGTTSSACVVASEEVKEQVPFRDSEDCGAVRGTSTIPPSSMLPIATLTTCRKGSTTTALDAASKEVEDQIPFPQIEDCGVVRGSTPSPLGSTSLFVPTTTRHSDTITTDLDAASEQGESPFLKEVIEEGHGSAVALSPLIPFVTGITYLEEVVETASDVVFDQHEEGGEQFPFQQDCGAVLGTTSIPPSFVPPFVTTTTRRSGTSTSACVVASKEEQERGEQLPFSDTECCMEVHGMAVVPTSAPSIASTTIRRSGLAVTDLDAASDQQEEDHPFLDSEDLEAVHGVVTSQHTLDPLIASVITRQGEPIITDLDVVSKQEDKEDQLPFRDTDPDGAVLGITTLPPFSMPPIVSTSIYRNGVATLAFDVLVLRGSCLFLAS